MTCAWNEEAVVENGKYLCKRFSGLRNDGDDNSDDRHRHSAGISGQGGLPSIRFASFLFLIPVVMICFCLCRGQRQRELARSRSAENHGLELSSAIARETHPAHMMRYDCGTRQNCPSEPEHVATELVPMPSPSDMDRCPIYVPPPSYAEATRT